MGGGGLKERTKKKGKRRLRVIITKPLGKENAREDNHKKYTNLTREQQPL